MKIFFYEINKIFFFEINKRDSTLTSQHLTCLLKIEIMVLMIFIIFVNKRTQTLHVTELATSSF